MNLNFIPKNKDVEKYFDRLTKYPVIRIDPRIAQTIGRYKDIKFLRKENKIFFALDRPKRKSIMGISEDVNITKKNGRFIFKYK